MIADVFVETFNGYVDGVLSGEIVAGKLVRAACERHQRDIARQSTVEFPFHFDWSRARKVCNFYPMVLRHSVGRYAGMPFELEPWQLFCEGSIFGWVRDADDTRRFRTVYESVARKNGKSTRCAGRALFLARFDHNPIAAARQNKGYCPEPVSQVVLAAAKREQAVRVLYAEVTRMRLRSPEILNGSTDVNKQVTFMENSGEIITTGSDKEFDGLNPHAVFMDEIHAWRKHQRKFHDTMVTGSGYRDQPLICYVTTAGDDTSQVWLEIYGYAKRVVTQIVEDDSYFVFIAEADEGDDPYDRNCWQKANPNLGISVSEKSLEELSKKLPENTFRRYHLNQQVSSKDAVFDMDEWRKCAGELSDWKDAEVIFAGVDLGGRDDLAAYAFVARFPCEDKKNDDSGEMDFVYRYEAIASCYIANNTKRDLTKQPWSDWIAEGWLIASDSPITDMTNDFCNQAANFGVSVIAYDPYTAQQFAEIVQANGITPVRCSQSPVMFAEPINTLREVIKDGRFKHGGNKLLTWCASNAVLIQKPDDKCMYDKASSSDKIDPIVAMTMAFRQASMAPARAQGSLYL